MPLSEFKFIYYMEFSHRMLGRVLGVFFGVPLLYFGARGYLTQALQYRLAGLFALGGVQVRLIFITLYTFCLVFETTFLNRACMFIGWFLVMSVHAMQKCTNPAYSCIYTRVYGVYCMQGSIGWWMVKSGLEETPHTFNDLPRVSPYRLATHLISAFIIYGLLFTTGLRVMSHARLLQQRLAAAALPPSTPPLPPPVTAPRYLQRFATATSLLVGATAFSGAFVAGNEAGLVHNDFPTMGGEWIPSDLINPAIQPAWKNWFENSVAVQFNHRYLGMGTAATCAALFFLTRRVPTLPREAQLAAHSLIGMAGVQVALGIATLLSGVPVPLAATHQAGSLTLLTFALWLAHTLRAGPALTAAAAIGSIGRATAASATVTATTTSAGLARSATSVTAAAVKQL
jgi:heme A synthase